MLTQVLLCDLGLADSQGKPVQTYMVVVSSGLQILFTRKCICILLLLAYKPVVPATATLCSD